MIKRIIVLISGSGTNLQAIIDAVNSNQINAQIVNVISNRADAYGLERASKAGIATSILKHQEFDNREAFDNAMINIIDPLNPDLIVLAGFMRILSLDFVEHYYGKLINIHPSLLPAYKGLNTHKRVLEAGDNEHGCSVHFVTDELDDGPVIIQGKVQVSTQDSIELLQQKVHTMEHKIYPLAVEWFCAERLHWTNQGVMLDSKLLPSTGYSLKADGDL